WCEVIPGRCEASNPESRDSGSGPSDHPGMTKSLRDLVDLRHLLRGKTPRDRLYVLLDLLDAGGAGDDAGDLRTGGEPGEGQLQHGVAARRRKCLQLLDDLLVAWRDVAVAQPRHLAEAGIAGRGLALLVLAGEQPASERKERQHAEPVFLRRRQQVLLDVAHHERVFVLAGNEAADVH